MNFRVLLVYLVFVCLFVCMLAAAERVNLMGYNTVHK